MKKTLLFAAMAALLMIASCQKEEVPSQDQAKDPVFTAIIEDSATKTTIGTDGKVAWVLDDEITVTDNASPKVSVAYTVSAIDGSGKATFTKKSGETKTLGAGPYTAVYGSVPLTSQTYSSSIPSLPMTGVSGTSDTNLKFTVSCGLLKITLTQTGESIKSISVSDKASTPNTYTLDCGSGVSIESGATFYIAVPAGTYTTFQFTNGTDVVRDRTGLSIVVTANHIKPVSSNFAPKYTSGTTDADYGIKVGDKWWAPVNCGYDATNYPMGLLYQWGRKYGQANEPVFITPTAMNKSDDTEENKGKFGLFNDTDYNWFSGGVDNTLWNGGTKGVKDPCPEGWRVPTESEMTALMGSHTGGDLQDGSGIYREMKGKYFDGSSTADPTSGLFLPTAGSRDYDDGSVGSLYYGSYWSSSVDDYSARLLFFDDNRADVDNGNRAGGFSVRCVQE